MDIIKFTVYGNPKALKRHKTFNKNKNGDFLKKPIQMDPSRKDKESFLVMAMQYRPCMPIDFPVALHIKSYFARPNSHYRTGKYSHLLKPKYNNPFCTTYPDFDNILKFIADALNGIFWKDDKFICDSSIKKFYAEDKTPKIIITIKDAEV